MMKQNIIQNNIIFPYDMETDFTQINVSGTFTQHHYQIIFYTCLCLLILHFSPLSSGLLFPSVFLTFEKLDLFEKELQRDIKKTQLTAYASIPCQHYRAASIQATTLIFYIFKIVLIQDCFLTVSLLVSLNISSSHAKLLSDFHLRIENSFIPHLT